MTSATSAAPERIDKAGRQGWRFADGAILWDDGEKEVPTSGLSDEQKRAEARRMAGDSPEMTKAGVSQHEIAAIEAVVAIANDPERLLAMRKAGAKARSGKKPENQADLPPTDVELKANLRIEVKKLLERELDRADELKTMAIAGQIELGRGGARVGGGNPPMQLHEAMLTAMRVSDSGTPEQMLQQLQGLRAWHPHDVDPGLPNPPSGMPDVPVVIPPPPDTGATPQASRDVKDGGKPTEYPASAPE